MAADQDSVFQQLAEDGANPVELLIIGCDATVEHRCAIALRNIGQAVHVDGADTAGKLAQLLETEPGDLVIVNADSKKINVDTAVDMVRDSNPAANIILVTQDPQAWLEYAMGQNLRDVVPTDEALHLAFSVRREHQTLLLRQRLSQIKHQLEESEQRFDSLMGKSRDAIAYVHEGMHIQANNVYRDMFGIDNSEEIEGLPLMDLIAETARAPFKKALRKIDQTDNFTTQVICCTQDGQTFDAEMEFSPAEVDGEPCTQIVIRDQSMQDALQARIDELTNIDAHTHLYNRQAFMERLEQSLPSLKEGGGGMIKLAISNYDDLRNHAGIDVLDKLLLTTAQSIQEQLPQAHTIARFGESIFVALIESGDNLLEDAERCLSALRSQDHIAIDLVDAPTIAIGVAPLNAEGITAHELVNRCRQALAKATGLGEYQLYLYNDAANDAFSKDIDQATVDLIDHALEHNGFQLVYQPVVSLQGDTRESYSVLIRLLDQQHEVKLPETFLAQAAKAERLAEIDRWVVRNAIAELVKHRKAGKKINFHITLSPAGFTDESMLLWICDCLREFKAKGAWLAFQFNEHELRSQVQTARKLIEGLKKINCKVIISHYQDSAGSETLVKHLPVDIVKLSPDFMQGLANDTESQERLIEANNKLQGAGVKTIASGVEDANSLAILWNVGVNYIQGYFLQEPSSSIAFNE